MRLSRTFGLSNEAYPLRELLSVFGGGGDIGNETEPKLFLTRSVRIPGHTATGRWVWCVRITHHFGKPLEEPLICHDFLVSHNRRILRDA